MGPRKRVPLRTGQADFENDCKQGDKIEGKQGTGATSAVDTIAI